jgi:hypothetical protein
METCPSCGAKFPPPKARGGYATLTIFRGGVLDTKVRCLDCGHVFQARSIRFLGFLGPRALKLVVGAFVAIVVATLIYVLVLKPLL